MATTADHRRRFFGDTRSLKSFGSSLPSLKTSSLKAKHHLTLVIPSILGRGRGRRWTQSGDPSYINPPSGDRGTHVHPSFPKPPAREVSENMLSTSSQTARTPVDIENYNTPSREKPQRTHTQCTKPKAFMGFISKTFRSNSPPPNPSPTSPTHPRSPIHITSVFASRENRDAALRERGLLPPLKPNTDLSQAERQRDLHLPVLQPPSHEEVLVLNGELVKMSAALKIKQEWEATNKVVEQKSPCNSGDAPSNFGSVPATIMDRPLPIIVHSRLEHSFPRSMTPSLVRSGTEDPIQSYPELEPYLVPLPLSPLESPRLSVATHLRPPASIPLPPSPALSIGSSLSAGKDSPSIPIGFGLYDSTHNASQTSAPSGSIIPGAPVTKNNIPIIIESPVEEIQVTGVTVPSITDEHIEIGHNNTRSAALLKPRTRSFTHSAVPDSREHRLEHRKSFNPFKRSQTLSPSSDATPQSEASTKRLSMAMSFNNFRRSFIGTLSPSRPKLPKLNVGNQQPDEGVDVMLPPSPSPATQSPRSPKWSPVLSQYRSSPQLAPPRKALSPTYYSRGSILIETANIEDEEMRRVTELAFLG